VSDDRDSADIAPVSELPLGDPPYACAPGADLPHQVIDILRQRGIESGHLLLLAEGSFAPRRPQAAPQFQLTRVTASEAITLSHADPVAVVILLENAGAQKAEALLASIATRLAPGIALALLIGRYGCGASNDHPADPREGAQLMLLRAGYERVWVHQHRGMLCVSARRAGTPRAPRTCSIIVPVYNEKATFPELMRSVLAKPLEHLGLEREVIIVESNSTDGSRELVAGLAGTPGVKVLWQDRPLGKGHAVREALRAATGDIVLIQDADLEYEVNDYDALLEPLLKERAAFVLGSRHSGQGPMRVFADEQRLISQAFNFGHLCFTALINILYGQKLRDPFTMFKVFRRDCLYGLTLECNRFDFDHELLIKLVLKGYRPLEIPVRYRSRSFKQGKKIRPFRDALSWLQADFKYRLQRLRPHLD
jgi:hypothetical protein